MVCCGPVIRLSRSGSGFGRVHGIEKDPAVLTRSRKHSSRSKAARQAKPAAGRFETLAAILIAGPTASGKSALAIRLARRFSGVVINCDSMQVYRDLRIVTARPSAEDERAVPHLLFGHVDAALNWSVGLWLGDAAGALAQARERGLVPILVGGTGLYFKALTQGLSAMPPVPETVRRKVRELAQAQASPELHRMLAAKDPLGAAKLRPSDRQRIIRALEIFEATGRSLREWQEGERPSPLLAPEPCVRLFLEPDRDELRRRIDQRFEAMLAQGALDEIRRLAARRLDPSLPAMRAHGVPWLLAHLRGEISLADAALAAKADTRRYARRQFTWFRHQMPGWSWQRPENAEELVLTCFEALAHRKGHAKSRTAKEAGGEP
ncbi:MAG: tRNA (adenosine(37)-N6)-dimethylallyltransferase MiaA [Hyphomicrobiales bacterium]|nr:tRNA (adenosine(37)-N6)-dimethylallyltransferase MiaA [Hyphomicrobiales bacterium]